MKKNILFLVAILLPCLCFSQITLEHTYSNKFPLPSVVLFENNGKKIVAHDTSSQEVKIYDMQHNLWKTIPCPWYVGWRVTYLYAISDNLFNSDNNVEMAVVYTRNVGSGYKSVIIDEFGSVMQDLDSAYQVNVHKDGNNNYKLFAYYFRNNQGGMAGYDCKIYSLPGTMPCDECNSLKVGDINGSIKSYISEPIPNPSTGKVTINYQLPSEYNSGTLTMYNIRGQIIAEYPLNGNRGFVTVENNLPSGNYIYNIRTIGFVTETKKMLLN